MTKALWRFFPLLILALAWEMTTRAGLISEYALPRLSGVGAAFFRMLTDDLWVHTLLSLKRGALGMGMAIVIGIAAGILMAWYRPFRVLINPIFQCLYPMPKSALIPVMIIWLGMGDASSAVLIFIGCLLPIVTSSFNAARGVEDVLLWSARGLGATEREVLWEIVIPASLPEILNGIRTAMAMAFILMISTELIMSRNGIGYLIGLLGENGDYEGMFAGVFAISALGFIFDRVYVRTTRRVLAWVD